MDARIILTFFLITSFAGCAHAQCSSNELDKCLEKFSDSSKKFMYSNVSCNDIDMECGAYWETVKCVEMMAKCKDEDLPALNKWTGMKMSIGMVCGKGKEYYLKSQKCLSYEKFKMIYMQNCPETYENPIESGASAEEACRKMKETITCAKGAAMVACGSQAAMLVGYLKLAYMSPQVKRVSPSCDVLQMAEMDKIDKMPESKCDKEKLDACLETFEPYATGFALGTVDASNIEDACESWNVTRRCILDAQCYDIEPEVMSKWLGRKTTIGYCCGKGKLDYLQNQQCLASQNFLQALGACGIADRSNEGVDPFTACQKLSEKLKCIDEGTRRTCDESTTKFMNTIAPWILGADVQRYSPKCSTYCNETALDECTAGFEDYAKAFFSSQVTEDQLDEACSAFYKTDNCVLKKAWCMENDAITLTKWTARRNIISRFCGEMRQDYLKHQECLGKPAANQEIGKCFQNPIKPDMNRDAACEAYNEQLYCTVSGVKSVCGEEAAYHVSKLSPLRLGPRFYVLFPDCPKKSIDQIMAEKSVQDGGSNSATTTQGLSRTGMLLMPIAVFLALVTVICGTACMSANRRM